MCACNQDGGPLKTHIRCVVSDRVCAICVVFEEVHYGCSSVLTQSQARHSESRLPEVPAGRGEKHQFFCSCAHSSNVKDGPPHPAGRRRRLQTPTDPPTTLLPLRPAGSSGLKTSRRGCKASVQEHSLYNCLLDHQVSYKQSVHENLIGGI